MMNSCCRIEIVPYNADGRRTGRYTFRISDPFEISRASKRIANSTWYEEKRDIEVLSALHYDIDYDHFELERDVNHDPLHQISISGDRRTFMKDPRSWSLKPIQSAKVIRLSVISPFGRETRKLAYEDVARRSNDYALVAFFNSSLKSLSMK